MEKNKNQKKQEFDFSFMEDKIQEVQDVIEKAVNSRDFQKMSESIGRTINRSIKQYQRERTAFDSQYKRKETEQRRKNSTDIQKESVEIQNLYASMGREKVKSILQTVFGGILTGVMGSGLFAVQLIQFLMDIGSQGVVVFMLPGIAIGVVMLYTGGRGLRRIGRFKKYIRTLGNKTYCDLEKLARAVGKSVRFVKKDIKGMIEKGWFLEGNLDRKETCLITSTETYHQYEETERVSEYKKQQEILRAEERAGFAPEVQEVLARGEKYLEQIRKSNEAIPGEEISAKIYKMEQIVDRIFQRAEEHPEIISDLKRMMDYYLPMTVKLLDAYEDMDSQPVQGETISSSKKEIEDTLDTLNDAFAKLLDSVFQDTAWDVSSDISVLHTILAQEGLKDSDFKTEN